MHLAICDDNIAHRKQTERLLERESDRRIAQGRAFYVESFGSASSLLYAPRIFDALFLDLTAPGADALEVVRRLRADGSDIPVIFCCSTHNYREMPDLPSNCFFLDKPLLVAELSAMIDQVITIRDSRVHTIEFRNHTETFYLTEPEILWAVPCEDGRHVSIHLTDGTVKQAATGFSNFCTYLAPYSVFFLANKNAAFNIRYVRSINPFSVVLQDDTSLKTTPRTARLLQKDLKRFTMTDQA